ncbi:hypothetical protein [Planctomyces sp. SH-PL62]|uniref:hypothetical protein n=1 Tax=Planctomyces sp. SH-PL62 TaxID=1636152 RepID=UPI00078D5E28|nr:hypothetical protein [Planctomyces sp. SH-PL62]AMV36838.1 hypothetical protein VT85_05360 [Planctomyces sp. SH-PL62]
MGFPRPPTGDGTIPILPPEALPLLSQLVTALTQPTYLRFATLQAAAILTQCRRTAYQRRPSAC